MKMKKNVLLAKERGVRIVKTGVPVNQNRHIVIEKLLNNI